VLPHLNQDLYAKKVGDQRSRYIKTIEGGSNNLSRAAANMELAWQLHSFVGRKAYEIF